MATVTWVAAYTNQLGPKGNAEQKDKNEAIHSFFFFFYSGDKIGASAMHVLEHVTTTCNITLQCYGICYTPCIKDDLIF